MSSNNNNKTTVNGGIGFFGVLQVALIVLKLCNVIDWSWWAVFIPLWIDLALIVLALCALFFYYYIFTNKKL